MVIAQALSTRDRTRTLTVTPSSGSSPYFMQVKGGSRMNHWGGADSSSVPLGGCLLPRTSFDVGQLFCLHPPPTVVVGLALLALIGSHTRSVQDT